MSAWLRNTDGLSARTNTFAHGDQLNSTSIEITNNSNVLVEDDLVWCNNAPALDHRFNIAFFVSCLTFAITSCGFLVILRSKELRRMVGGILMCSMCLTGMIAPLMQAVNNFTVTGLHVVLPVCITTQILTNTMSCVAFTTIAAMALDRAVAVTWHMRYFEVMTSVKCRIFLLIQWSLCLLVNCVPAMDTSTTWCMKRYNGCGYRSSAALYSAFSVIYLPSIIIIFGSYIKVWCVIRKLQVSTPGPSQRSRTTGVRTTILIFLAFILCTLPITVYATLNLDEEKPIVMILEDIGTYMFNLSPAVSIAIYGGTHRKFKKSVRQLLRLDSGHRVNSYEGSSASNKTVSRKMSPAMFTVASMQV